MNTTAGLVSRIRCSSALSWALSAAPNMAPTKESSDRESASVFKTELPIDRISDRSQNSAIVCRLQLGKRYERTRDRLKCKEGLRSVAAMETSEIGQSDD